MTPHGALRDALLRTALVSHQYTMPPAMTHTMRYPITTGLPACLTAVLP